MIVGCITARERTIHGIKVSSVCFFIGYIGKLKLEVLVDKFPSQPNQTTIYVILYSICAVQNHICLFSCADSSNSILQVLLTAAGKAIQFLSKLPQQMTTLLKV